jgi:pimeloyl-ACP methyl ester carboxylesterase
MSAGNYIVLNGVRLYYEVHGEGAPLVLIHGNGRSSAYMKPQIDYFSKSYTVIAVDCRGRGKSELGKDTLTYDQMTKDVIDLLDHLHLDSTYVIGRSDGGIIGLLMAINYPEKVSKVAAFGANLTPDAKSLYPSVYNQAIQDRKHADEMIAKKDTSENWLLIQQRNLLMELQPHITADDLRKIKCPVLVLSCDRDTIQEEHTLFIYRNIPKSNLCIFPGETHWVTSTNPDLFNSTVSKWFSEPFKGEEIRK